MADGGCLCLGELQSGHEALADFLGVLLVVVEGDGGPSVGQAASLLCPGLADVVEEGRQPYQLLVLGSAVAGVKQVAEHVELVESTAVSLLHILAGRQLRDEQLEEACPFQ